MKIQNQMHLKNQKILIKINGKEIKNDYKIKRKIKKEN